MHYDVIIVGGGAAGMTAAVQLPPFLKILILERNDRLGKKILATGNGRCNFSNTDLELTHFHGANPWFCELLLHRYGAAAIRNLFLKWGLMSVVEEGRIYPYSRQAKSVRQMFLNQLAMRPNVTIKTGHKVIAIRRVAGLQIGDQLVSPRAGFEVCAQVAGSELQSDRSEWVTNTATNVLVCAGGKAAPGLGTDGSAYGLVTGFDHPIVPPRPALVQLICADPSKKLAGIRLRCAAVLERDRTTNRPPVAIKGEILLTDYGLSGIPILDLSTYISSKLRDKPVTVRLDLMPESSAKALLEHVIERRRTFSDLPAVQWGTSFLPQAVSAYLLQTIVGKRSKNMTMGRLNMKRLEALVKMAKEWPRQVVDSKGFQHAQVTAGGIDTGAFDPETLESLICPGLFCAGEMLDVHGDCGGYNLHWAWVSGLAAAAGIGAKYRS
ncbi:MAG TPA: aminoacetone oxidase family FAD-binding enzyme [Clostridiaceae bacterium]|nr:aminoacetone oxidase family FAD-binding enzyme [Clostridiaceae bacterium]